MQNDAMHRLITTAKLLYANSVSCSIQHHENNDPHDLPGWLADCAGDIEAAEAALAAAPAGAVKPLDWRSEPPHWVARVFGTHYAVERHEDGATLTGYAGRRDYASFSEAKAAAQAHYETAIRSALASPVAQATDGWQPTHRHKKRGTDYEYIGAARIQSDVPLADMESVEVYRGHDGDLWARRQSEFHDGRFEVLPAAPTPKAGGRQ